MRAYSLFPLLSLAATSIAHPADQPGYMGRRQLPEDPTGVQTIITANNITIRYKEPGKEGVCETTPGVKSYSGYVDLSPTSHTFFWFFEARKDPQNAPITLWLNGGPGSDSLIGLFEELGPCHINSSTYETYLNDHSFSEVSNLLFLSQPLGTGFSYSDTEVGSINPTTGSISEGGEKGRYPTINATLTDTTDLAAKAAWEVLQGFMGSLPKLDSKIKSKHFNLWTESYGGHYGPAFFNHFREQNEKIESGEKDGIALDFQSLGIINGIIDESIQAPHYPEFAKQNTYGIQTINDTVYNYMKFAYEMPNGCREQIGSCKDTNLTSLSDYSICTQAANMCRDNVEGPWYSFSHRSPYDIRTSESPPAYYSKYLEQDSVKQAIGVNLNYTASSQPVYYVFQQTGDFVWPNFIDDLEQILNLPVRVSLIYGDADYICNWFGGQAISLAANHSHADQFRAAGYAPMTVDGVEYGETREYGNFSFTRVYEAGHEVPFYQPIAALQLFNRTLNGWDIAKGTIKIDEDYATNGKAKATHTEPAPSSTSSASPSASASSRSNPGLIH